jgi:hypothetical protein
VVVAHEIAENLSSLQARQSEIICKYVLGMPEPLAPIILADAVNFVLQLNHPITHPKISVRDWLPEAIIATLDEQNELGQLPDKKTAQRITFPYSPGI